MRRVSVLFAVSLLFACGAEPSPQDPVVLNPDMETGSDVSTRTPDMSGPDMSDPDMSEPDMPAGPMLEVPERTWSWVDVEGMKCADGSDTGVGINYNPASSDVVFYFAGGGACWNALTCYQFSTAANITGGYNETKFMGSLGYLGSFALFDRALEDNPMRDATYIAVPYCTGDVHAGTKITDHNGRATQHVGYNNFTAILETFAPEFQGAQRVVMSGSSAGGYGASFNLGQARERFPTARVDLINDGGPPMQNPGLESQWRAAWGLDAILPPDCPECGMNLRAFFSYAVTQDPQARVALLSYQQDGVISQFYGLDAMTFERQLGELQTQVFDPSANARVFVTPGTQHTMFGQTRAVMQSGTTAWSWLQAMLNDDPNWNSVVP